MLEVGYVVTLDDNNQYTIIDKFDKGENTYVYLVDINNMANFIYAKVNGGIIEEITSLEELKMVVGIVNKNIHS